jgi:UDP:flavonoid glycosyltransferase YjiC (YdhE family)
VRIDYRWGGGDADRVRKYAAELLALRPDVVFASGGAVEELLRATSAVPIVFAIVPDPVGSGFVDSLSRPALRNYRIPAFADTPRTEVVFADTHDKIGPLGAKSQGECAINAVAPAVANALANATGVRFAHLPFTPDRIFDKLGVAT